MKRKEATYVPQEKLVVTHISGDLDANDINDWRLALTQVFNQLPDGARFKILVNLHGFKAVDFESHKQFRTIIPLALANYGWYIGYLRLFPEAEITIRSERGIHCIAAAHVHHDETKITNYDTNFRMRNERFFTDPQTARAWIDGIVVPD
ncbi:hypothetical protein [Spirosoma fluminis]